MDNWKKRYIIMMTIVGITFILATVILICNISLFSQEIAEIIKVMPSICFIFILVSIIIFFVISAIFMMKRGLHNIRECDDPHFSKIDAYKECWKEDRYGYIRQIQIINLCYGEAGDVDTLVDNKEIEKLLARAEYLQAQNDVYNNFITCFYSLIISVIASFVCQMLDCNNVFLMFMWVVTILFSFWSIVLMKYAERGQAGSYKNNAYTNP